MTDKYFATLPVEEVGAALRERVDRYWNFMNGSGIFNRMWYSHLHYHGLSPTSNSSSHQVNPGGKHGQLAMVKVNHFRNLGQHLVQLTTSQRPAPQPIATNSDAKSQKQTTLAKGILEYYSREMRVDRVLRDAAELAVVMSEGFVKCEWDGTAGNSLGEGTNGPIREGDVRVSLVSPTDIIRDPNKDNYGEFDWIIVRNWKNKYEVAAKYGWDGVSEPQGVVAKILGSETKNVFDRTRISMITGMYRTNLFNASEDIAVFEFFHKRGPSLADGRMVTFLADGTILNDKPLPYRSIPVRRISPGALIGSPYGYTPMFDMLAIQQIIDSLYSAIATNQITFGVQLIMAQKGSDLDFKQLARGLSFIEYDDPQFKPEPLNLVSTPKEIFEFIQQLETAMETVSGVNSVVRGNPESSLKSGSALALVQSQAIQFSSGLQQSYAHLIEDVYTDILNIIKEYAKTQRTVTLVGKYNRSMIATFVGEDINDINRVVVQSGSSLEQTLSGRMQIAQDLLQNQLIKKPEEYLSVVNTGRLEPMLEGDNAELMLIRSENEAMASAQEVHAVPTDEHSLHIREHKAVLSTPESRSNPQLLQMVSAHMVEHVNFLADPMLANLLMVLGQQPLQAAMMPAPGQGYAPGAPTPSGGGDGAQLPTLQAPEPEPGFPTNPQTGMKWDPDTGGGAVIPDTSAGIPAKPGMDVRNGKKK